MQAYLHKSNAFRKSPLTEDTLRAQNWIAEGSNMPSSLPRRSPSMVMIS